MKRNINTERRAQIGQEKRARTRVDILRASFDLLGREDGRDTRVDDVCRAARVSRGTFYNYFPSLTALLDELGYEISNELNVAIREVMMSLNEGAERAAAAVRYYLYRAREDRAWAWAVVNLSAPGPLFGADTFHWATKAIADGIACGDFHLPSAELGRDLCLGTVLAALITLLRGDQDDHYPELVTRQILVGLGVSTSMIERCVAMTLPYPLDDLHLGPISGLKSAPEAA